MGLYEERRKKRAERYEVSTSSKKERITASSSDSKYLTRRKERDAMYPKSNLDDTYISNFLRDAQSFLSGAASAYNSISGDNKSSIYQSKKQTSDDLRVRSSNIRRYLEKNKDAVGAEGYSSLISQLDDFDKENASIAYAFYNAQKYDTATPDNRYAEATALLHPEARVQQAGVPAIPSVAVQDAEPYKKRFERDNAYRQKYQGKTYDQLNAVISAMEDGEEKNWLSTYAPSVMTAEDYDKEIAVTDTNLQSMQAELRQLVQKGSVDSFTPEEIERAHYLQEEIKNLSQKKDQLDNERKYNFLYQNEDYKEKSGYASTAAEDWLTETFSQYNLGYSDLTYEYINNQDGIRDKIRHEAATHRNSMDDFEIYDNLSENEVATYNYLYSTEGKEAAQAYLEYLQPELNARNQDKTRRQAAVFATENPNLANLASVGATLVSGVGELDALGQKIENDIKGDYYKPIDMNTGAMTPSIMSSTIRGTRAQNLADKYGTIQIDEEDHPILGRLFNGKSLGDVYQLGMSMVDSTATALLSPVLSPASTLLLAGSSATQTMLSAAENGATDEQALWMGALSGAFEYLFEKYELESLLKNGSENAVRALISQSLSEGFGEGMTTVSNLVADTLIMADKSELNRTIEAYREQHPDWSEEKLRTEALKDLAIQTGWDVVGGAVSGGIMGGGYSVINKGIDKLHSLAQEKVDAEQQALQQLAEEMNGVDETENTAQMDGVKYSIKRTQNMSWDEQISGALKQGGSIVHSDTLVLDDTPVNLVKDGVENKRLAIPLSVITKAKNGKDSSHSINDQNLKNLQKGVRNAPIVINNPGRNALVFVTDIQQDGAPVLVAFQKNAQFDGDDVHKATSIHLQMDVASMLKALPAEATIYAKNESELDTAAGITDSLRSISANVKFTGNTVAENVAGVNGEISSAEGQVLRGSDPVQIADVESAGKGKLTVKLTDGSTADVSELSFPDMGEQELWRVLAEYCDNAEAARQLLKEYRAGDLKAFEFAKGVEEGFIYGKLNISEGEMAKRGSYVNLLNPMQRNMAYKYGQYAGEKQTRQRQQSIDAEKKSGNDKKGQLHFDGDRDSLTHRQKVSLQACEVIAKALGIQVYIFESELNSQGKRVGDNGWYDPNDGSVHIDLHAGENGEGVMVFTLAHELTHFIKDWSPAKFRTLSTFLAQQYGKKGLSVRDMILRQQAKAKQNGRELTFEQAHEEWVADSMEMMLTDGAILEKLSMLQAKDKGLAQKIRQFLDNFLKRLKAAYNGVSPQTVEGHIVSQMVDAAQLLQDLFAEAMTDAGENYRSAEKNTTGEGSVRHMSREESASIKEQLVAASEKLNEMDVVVSVVSDGFAGLRDSDVAKELEKEFSKFGNKIDRKDFGVILLSYQQINKALNYLKMPSEKAAMLTVPRVLKRGIQIDAHTKHKERGVDSYTFAAPVEINGKRGNVGVVVQRVTGTNRFKTLRILLPNGKAFEFTKNIEADSTAGSSSKHQSPEGIPIESASINSISKKTEDVKKNDSTERKHSSRSDNAVSDRAMLVDMFEQMVTDSNEYKVLQSYKKHMNEMLALEEKVERLTAEIGRLSFAEGPRDTEYLNKLKLQKKQAINRLNYYDSKLLGLEKSGVLKAMIERNRKQITQESFDRAREYYRERNQRRENEIREYYRESRRKAVERHDASQMRQKLKRVVRDLWKLQETAPKDRRTKEELREFVDSAIKAADLVWLERYDEYDMVRNGVGVDLRGDEPQLLQECRELLEKHLEISEAESRWDIEGALQAAKDKAALDKELAKRMKKLRDAGVFAEEFKRVHEMDAGQLIDNLIESYEKLNGSNSPYLQGAYQEVLPTKLQQIRNEIGAKPVRNMTLQELEQLYDAYSAVLHVVRNANKVFADNRAADVTALGTGVVGELEGFKRQKWSRMVIESLKKTGWNNLTPAYAFRQIGSGTLERLYKNLVNGMGTYGRDIAEAKLLWQAQAKKHGANNWDMEARTEFVDRTGKKFSLSLGQLMSLYALSKRQQALGHLEIGGIMLDTTEAYVENIIDKVLPKVMTNADTFKLDKAALEGICSKLTAQQKAFVDATQAYLSKDMSEKGNEVSMKLYGIRLFKEKHYFPLRTASQTRYESTELVDQHKLKNSGFTKEVNPKASNAVVLSDYSHVWTGHVKQMSLYHGMTLPMEDMDRVLNFGKTLAKDENGNVLKDEKGEVIPVFAVDSVSTTLQNIFGKHPEGYIRDLMKQLNGGVRADVAEDLSGKMMSRFKKAAVAASLSVWIQQWTSVFRSMAYVPMKYFFQKPMGTQRTAIIVEMKKYCPIAIIKEMGGFDTGIGNSEHDYITMAEPENMKQYVAEVKKHPMKRFDELTGWLPGRADETTWAHIWTAVKRETRDKHPSLRMGTDAFYKVAADRFTEVINLTQVYDSVLSKSALMRSKGGLAKMLTQFAAEPTLALNMAVDAMVQHQRTGKVQTGTALALVGSVVANAMSSALIYAMRDDDEEETFLEKYSASLLGNLLDGLNPLTYMPIIRDIWSMLQGYDVKRSDMEVWSQFGSSLEQIVRKYVDEDATDKERAEAWASAADWLLALFGVPTKNIRRELKGFGSLWGTLEQDLTTRATTAGSLKDTNYETFWSSVPLMRLIKGETKAEKLLDAHIAGDTHYADRLRSTYKDKTAADNAVVQTIKERFEEGKLSESDALYYLESYAGKTKEKAQNYLDKWNFAAAHPNVELTDGQRKGWGAYAEPAGISLEIYTQYVESTEGLTIKKDVVNVIHALPLTRRQKDALYLAEGYAESKLDEAPWN